MGARNAAGQDGQRGNADGSVPPGTAVATHGIDAHEQSQFPISSHRRNQHRKRQSSSRHSHPRQSKSMNKENQSYSITITLYCTGKFTGFSWQWTFRQIGSFDGPTTWSKFHQQVVIDTGRCHFGAIIRTEFRALSQQQVDHADAGQSGRQRQNPPLRHSFFSAV